MAKRSRQPTLAGFESPDKSDKQSSAATAEKPCVTGQKIAAPASPITSAADLASKTVYLVDAHSLIYQVFHALPEMSGPSGQPVGAVHGFVRDMLDLIEARGADLLICAFDHCAPTFRQQIDDQYKIHREEMPADLQLQMPVIRQFLDALGILSVCIEGFEADDILATLARQVEAAGADCGRLAAS